MIRAWVALVLYLLAFPVAAMVRLFGDPLALRHSHRGWRQWPKGKAGMESARRPYI